MTAFEEYLQEIGKNLAHGDATENTHRPALKKLLQSLGQGIIATNEPKRILCGAPDFNLTKGNVPLGHVETKAVGENLTDMERGKPPHGDQFVRYRDGLLNWILTDYLEFRWYVDGEHRWTARLGVLDSSGKPKALPGGEKEVAELLDAFLAQKSKTIGTAEDLAKRMAGMTRIIRDLIRQSFQQEVEHGWLHNWLVAFRKVLIPDLRPFLTDTEREKPKRPPAFDDMFAQTLAYGLFAARVHTPPSKDFSRELAAFNLPKTSPFLRKLFSEIAGVDMPETIDWAVDDLVALLNQADMAAVLKHFGTGKGRTDPVVHFYETFLTAYDPQMRQVRGVYYTPEPVVGYIVRSVDYLLKARFGREGGLADENTLILDPATGTATFLYFVIEQIFQKRGKQRGDWDGYVDQHLLNRVFGFELLIAPYAIAHLKLGMQLQQTGYTFGSGKRLGIYLTNTLEEAASKSEQLITGWIAEEANAAAAIKSDKPIMVVLGNPPYSGHSANRSWAEIQVTKGQPYVAEFGLEQGRVTEVKKNAAADGVVEVPTFIGRLIQDYYVADGVWLKERNPKWLQNDYVKFIRFAQWRIDKTGEGVIAYITSNSYLDSPTFRGMRQSLMRSFNEIYIYDLHGNSNKRERAPGGGEDQNVFDITEGVSLILCVKERRSRKPARVFRADILGRREVKYKQLAQTDVSNTDWKELKPSRPCYYFMPQNAGLRVEYERGWKLTEMLPVNVLGFQTHHDDFAIDFDKEALQARIAELRDTTATDEELRAKFQIPDTRDWKMAKARALLRADKNWQSLITKCVYRPFDFRFTYYSEAAMERPRRDLVNHMLGKSNLALNTTRQTKSATWQHAVVSTTPAPAVFVELKDGSNVFPLYLYEAGQPQGGKKGGGGTMLMALFESSPGYLTRRANINPKFIEDLTQRLGLQWIPVDAGDLRKTVGPEDVFNYAYAVFHSPAYRGRYAEFLKIDFPRLPLTGDLKLFRSLAAKGAELVALHVMESLKLDDFITVFPVKGTDEVEKVQYTDNDQRVWFNTRQYFGGVPKAVWEFHVGGYQVCEKWLKDRKGRKLSYDDIQHYQRIVVALSETMRLMVEIDAAIERHGGWPLKSLSNY